LRIYEYFLDVSSLWEKRREEERRGEVRE